MDGFPGFKSSDSLEDFRKKWHSFIIKKHMAGESILGIHLGDASAVEDLDDLRKVMENKLELSQNGKKKTYFVTTPPVDPLIQDEKVSKRKKKSGKNKTSLSELTSKEISLDVDERTRNNFEETIDEIEQNYGLEILKFMQEEAIEKDLFVCIKELPADVVKVILRKLRQIKTREMKLIVAFMLEEIQKTKAISTPKKFKKKKKRKKPNTQNQLLSLDSKSVSNAEENRDEPLQNFDFEIPPKGTRGRTKYLTLHEGVGYDDDTPFSFIQEDQSEFSRADTPFPLIQEDQLEFNRHAGLEERIKIIFSENHDSDNSSTTCESETMDSFFFWPIIFEDSLQLLETYEEIINELIIMFGLDFHEINDAIEDLIYNYSNVCRGETPSVINFNRMENCVGYLHRYAPCHAALVAEEVTNASISCPEIFSKLESKRKMNIVCLGGGPGNDLVGLLSAFTGMLPDDCVDRCDFTVVDKMSGWIEVFSLIIEKFVREKFDMFLADNVMPEFSAYFIEEDLTRFRTWGRGMREKLRKADVITMVKVLSNIPETHRLQLLENVVIHMKPGAMLFIIDCPKPPQELFCRNPSLKIKYKTEVREFDFMHKKMMFGCCNITTCRAATYVIEMHNANKTEHVPDLDDVTEWPTLT